MEQNDEEKKLNLLYEKSISVLKEQFDDYKTVQNKTATLISLSAFIFPIIISLTDLDKFNSYLVWLLLIPLLTYIGALILFCIILFPKQLTKGYKISKIDEQITEEFITILKKEIYALKKSFEINSKKIQTQNTKFIISIILTIFSVVSLCTIIFVNQVQKSENTSKKIEIKNIRNFNQYNINYEN